MGKTYDDIKSDWKQSFTLSSGSIFLKYILRVKAWIFLNETQILVFVESAIFHSILGKKYDTRYMFFGLSNPARCLVYYRIGFWVWTPLGVWLGLRTQCQLTLSEWGCPFNSWPWDSQIVVKNNVWLGKYRKKTFKVKSGRWMLNMVSQKLVSNCQRTDFLTCT